MGSYRHPKYYDPVIAARRCVRVSQMKIERLRESLARAERNAASGRELVARQSALVSNLGQNGSNTAAAESVLRTLQDSQRLQEDYVGRLTEEFKAVAPEEWKERQRASGHGQRSNAGNRLLTSLCLEDLASMQPLLQTVELRRRSHVQLANRKTTAVLFPESGMISVMAVTGVGRGRSQVGAIGRGGMTGIGVLFGWWKSPFELEVAVEGQAQSIDAEDLVDFVSRKSQAREVLLKSRFALLLQFAEIAAANAQGTVGQRLAHLLLLVEEELESTTIPLTHEQLASMMSVRRASVTMTLEQFQSDQLTTQGRGAIMILDHDGLEARASDLRARSNWDLSNQIFFQTAS